MYNTIKWDKYFEDVQISPQQTKLMLHVVATFEPPLQLLPARNNID